jgi:hypothetical protein
MSFSGQQAFSGTLVANTQQTITFGYSGGAAIRYAYFLVENTAAAGTIYVRTDGTAATVGGDMCTAVYPGTSVVVANQLAWWSPAANVIPAATSGAGAYTVASGSGPKEVTPMGTSPYGQTATPGSNVSVISSGTPTFTITGTG